MSNRVLLVDHNADYLDTLFDSLSMAGFVVTKAFNGQEAIEIAMSGVHDIAVIDVMLPMVSGIEVLKRIRKESEMPILMLTGHVDEIDKIVGLELGADDYIYKPCPTRELVARIRAILKRAYQTGRSISASTAIKVGKLTIWPEKHKAELIDKPVALTGAEFALLEVLVRNSGQVVSKEYLSDKALSRPLQETGRSIDMHLCNVRQKLGCLSDGRSYIQSIYGKGYVLIGD